MANVGGIILCGGQSSRMGQPKAWLPFGPETMLQRMVRILSEVVHPLVVVAAPEQSLPLLPSRKFLVARDEEKGRGPLQGLAAGLSALQGHCDAAYISGCDAPFLQPAFVKRMIELLGENLICVPFVGGFHHPLAGLYRLEVAAVVQRLLKENNLRTQHLFREVPTRFVEVSELLDVDPNLQSLRNLNTPEEYTEALRDAEFS